MAYKIVFEGKLKAGRTHAQTLQTLADMSRISLEKAEATFFSDKPVTVKQFDRLEIAREFQVRLRDAGLVVVVAPVAETPASGIAATPSAGQIFVRSTATVDQSEEPINAKAPDVTPSLKMKRHTQVHRRRLVWVAAAAALLLLMTGGGLSYYLHTLFDSSVPATVAQAEQALFSQETIFLGHVNVAQISRLERLAGRMSSVEELAAPYGSRLLNDLRRFGINPRIDVDQIVFALNAVPDGGVYLAMVILGKFDPERIRQFLEETYETTTERLNGTSVLLFKKLDRVTCAYSVERAAVIAPGIVLISLPDRMADIRQALNNNTVSDAVDSRWTAYRASHLASLGLFKPVQAARAVPGMGGRLLQGMQTQMASVQSVFLGAAGQILPPGLKVEMRVNTGDKQWVADTAAELRQHLAGRTAGKSRVVPLFMDRLVVDEVPGQLTAALTLDQGLVAAANEISNEGWGAFMSVDSGSPGSRPPEEMVDTDAGPYPAEVDLADLPAYESRHGERYAWRSGPLAATVHAVRLTPGELVEIELRITGRQIPNVPDADIGGSGTVAITAVTDRQGKALLRDEYCGREINSEPAVLKKSDGPAEIQAFKTIRLKSGVPLAAVAAIKARIALDIATRTQTRVLAIPLQDPVIKTDGFYLRFKQVRGGTVDYVVSGDRSRLLSIRGLNAARRYLRSTGAASFGGDGISTQSVSSQFQGEVNFIELVTAEALDTLVYELQLDTPLPMQGEGFSQAVPPHASYTVQDWDEVLDDAKAFQPKTDQDEYFDPVARTTAGPARLSLFMPKVSRRFDGTVFSSRLQMRMPYVAALDNRVNRAVLVVRALGFRDGQRLTHERRTPFQLGSSGGFKDVSRTEAQLRRSLHLRGDIPLTIRVPDDAGIHEHQQLQEMSGAVEFHLPQSIISIPMADLTLGKRVHASDFELQVIEIAAGHLTLSVDGDYADLVDVLILNPSGETIAAGPAFDREKNRLGVSDDEKASRPRAVVNMRFNGTPAELRLVVSEKSRMLSYPFVLVVK